MMQAWADVLEEFAPKSGSVAGGEFPMDFFIAVVRPARVMKKREQTNRVHRGLVRDSDSQRIFFHPAPM
jgi:hypothetical protein